ncbi:MAG: tetratricopeptide repeat protein [Candidatus Obscuribacterales bacterium]|nr:tetratricopeptide repeat protein [Candidatus Obscuribacterales bacterium]
MLGIIFRHPILSLAGLFAINLIIIVALALVWPKNGLTPGTESGTAGPNFRPYRHDVSKTLEGTKKELQTAEKEETTNYSKLILLTESLGDYLMAESEYAEAQQCYEKALTLREQAKAPKDDNYGQTLIALADAINEQDEEGDNTDKSIELLLKAKTAFEAAREPDEMRIYTTLTKLAGMYGKAEDSSKQEECLRSALTIAAKKHVREDGMLIDALTALANKLDESERYTESQKYYQQIVELNERELGTSNAGVATALVQLANSLINQNKKSEAETLYKRAFKIVEGSSQMDSSDVEDVMRGYIELLNDQPSRKAEAAPLAESCVTTIIQKFGSNSAQKAELLDRLASDFSSDGTYNLARIFYKRAIELRKEQSQKNADEYVDSLVGMGDTYQEEAQYQEAGKYYQQALAVVEPKKNNASYEGLLKSLADNYYFLHDFSQAERFYKERLASLKSASEKDNSAISGAAYDLGVASFAAGKYKDARIAYEESVKLSKDEDDQLDHASNVWALARTLGRLGDLKSEERNLRRIIAIYHDEEDSSEFEAATDLIVNLRKQQRRDEAAKVVAGMSSRYKDYMADEDNADSSAPVTEAYGSLLSTVNRNAEAEAMFRKALKDHEKIEAEEEHILDIKAKLAKALMAQGKYAEAEALYAQAAAHAEDLSYFTADECCELLHGYAAVLRKVNKPAEADKAEQRAVAVEKAVPSVRQTKVI